ncbi:NAD-dependent epimerase/dehydratase family protein [Protaetiibacter intestinalis]|nr:NAD-dependent epimerase/dehydratase family protein [Protaetiibacter intestinalis]
MTTYLVTGGAGFIGHHLVARLLDEGHRVIALDNGRSGRWDRVDARAERDERGIEDLTVEEWRARLDEVDVLYHLAAEKYNSSSSTPERVLDVNVVATERLFRAAVGAVEKTVFTSSLYAYGSMGPETMREADLPVPVTHYGASKLMGEHLLRVMARDAPFAWTVARLFFIYGPSQWAEGGYKSVIFSNFERIAAGVAPTIRGDGEQILDYVYIDDCIDALRLLEDHRLDGRTFNVATSSGVSINQLTSLMTEVSGYDGPVETVAADWTAGSRRVGDPEHLRGVGWLPKTELRDGLSHVWRWMNDR